jgi:hypothetical protein
MKLILSLSLLFWCFQLINAMKTPNVDELGSSLYLQEYEKAALFFRTAGTPVVDYVHPTLRTESDPVLHERATAHFTYYKDSTCDEIDYVIDLKINRCANFYGSLIVTLLSEVGSTFTVSIQQLQADCVTAAGDPTVKIYEKNACTPVDFTYVKFNLIAHPLKSIPGGGGAMVVYENSFDCHISTHTNLARAVMMITWPFGTCSLGYSGYVKAISCDADFLKFMTYDDENCDQMNAMTMKEFSATLDCPGSGGFPFLHPFKVLCIADTGPGNGGAGGLR